MINRTGELTATLPGDDGRWIKVVRGPLPGAGNWTHQYGDTGNTACSDDMRVKGPLGTLWYDLPDPGLMVERHARPAAPIALDGRLFVQGENMVMAYDAYNGTLLWEKEFRGAVRVRVDSDMSNLALAADGLYVATDKECLRLDPATGETMRTYPLPASDPAQPRRWGYLARAGNMLYGTSSAPLQEPYGNLWKEIVAEDGTWRDFDDAIEKRGLEAEHLKIADGFKATYAKPDTRAFWGAYHAGAMWRTMVTQWPAWGSVESPVDHAALTRRPRASIASPTAKACNRAAPPRPRPAASRGD